MPLGGCYYAVTGARTQWSTEKTSKRNERMRLLPRKAILIDAAWIDSQWHEANDLEAVTVVDILSNHQNVGGGDHIFDHGFLWRRANVRHVAFADGSVSRLHLPISRDLAEAIVYADCELTPSLSRELAVAQFAPLDLQVCVGVPVFLLIATWPAASRIRIGFAR